MLNLQPRLDSVTFVIKSNQQNNWYKATYESLYWSQCHTKSIIQSINQSNNQSINQSRQVRKSVVPKNGNLRKLSLDGKVKSNHKSLSTKLTLFDLQHQFLI